MYKASSAFLLSLTLVGVSLLQAQSNIKVSFQENYSQNPFDMVTRGIEQHVYPPVPAPR